MKLHESVVARLIQLCELWGSFKENSRLKEEFKKLELDLYKRQTDGKQIIVLTEDLKNLTTNKK